MKMFEKILFVTFLLFIIFPSANATSGSFSTYTNNFQSSAPYLSQNYGAFNVDEYWPILTKYRNDECSSISTDFIVAIPPGGCDPDVVRSDLLAEQNVPVFCKLSAIRINPLIDSSTITSISFSGDLPDGVAGISYHPADAAIKNYKTIVSDAIEKDIGSVVITLKKQPKEEDMEKYISGILTANIRYNSELSYGIGESSLYLEPMDDSRWDKSFSDYSFWARKGYLRAESLNEDSVKINILLDKDTLFSNVYLKEGETSQTFYYPGYYCTVGFKLKLESVTDKGDVALINVNGDSYWVKENSKIGDTGCFVRELNVLPGGAGDIDISCPGANRMGLSIGGEKIVIKNSTNESIIKIGDFVVENGKRYYLGYYRGEPIDDRAGNLAIVFNISLSNEELSLINSVLEDSKSEEEINQTLNNLYPAGSRDTKFKDSFRILGLDGGPNDWNLSFIGFPSLEENVNPEIKELNEVYSTNFSEGNNIVSELISKYPFEEKLEGEYWGEEALFEQIKIASDLGNLSLQKTLMDLFIDKYPSSDFAGIIKDMQADLGSKDYTNSKNSVFINNKFYEFSLANLVSGSENEKSIKLEIEGIEKTLELNEVYTSQGNKWKESDGIAQLRVNSIGVDEARISYFFDKDKSAHNAVLRVGEKTTLAEGTDNSLEVRLKTCDVDILAEVKVIPEIHNKQTNVNFSFGFPIEQRTIQLTPERANISANNLNKTINTLKNTSEKFKEILKYWNMACTAVSGYFTVKNALGGLGGETIARDIVNSYYKINCSTDPLYKDKSLLNCYEEQNVESVVEEIAGGIKSINQEINLIRGAIDGEKDFFKNNIIEDLEEYIKDLKNGFKGFNETTLSLSEGGPTIHFDNISDIEQMRAALLYHELGCKDNPSSKACIVINNHLKTELSHLETLERRELILQKYGVGDADFYVVSDSRDKSIPVSIAENDITPCVNRGDYFKVISLNGKVYLVNLSRTGNSFNIEKICGWNDSEEWDLLEENSLFETYSFYEQSLLSCRNIYKNPEVRYYHSGYAEKQPAVVPIDVTDGWYAYIPSTKNLGYDESGNVNFFWICNVGENGIMEMRNGDDTQKCVSFNLNSLIFEDNLLCDLSSGEISKLYNMALTNIRKAQLSKEGIVLDDGISVGAGEQVSGSTELDCLDYMSAKDCKTLFNVCDPVVCPSSRCNLNGRYYVEDVTATGIIGGLTLCNQNKDDVRIPVCLTAVYSGLENLISVLEEHQSCLMRRVETGEYVGSCDRIYSVFLCDLIWKSPGLLQELVPSILDVKRGGGAGGEYLTGEATVKKVQENIGYFTDYYAKNVFDSFKLDQNLQYPSSFCSPDNFLVSGNISGDFLSDLGSFFEPESAPQAYSYFTESTYTTKTSPPTSQYKVYYQIYAGNQRSQTNYIIYLRNPPANYNVQLPPNIILDQGLLPEGESVSETLDFTAPSGYKELCVSLNEKEYCGFGSAGSSYLGDYASDLYVKSQLNKNIKTTSQCQSTSVSASLDPLGLRDISSTGLTRICASTNPSTGRTVGNKVYCNNDSDCERYYKCKEEVEGSELKVCYNESLGGARVTESNWVDVGYCDDPSIRCWMDINSVEGTLRTMNLSDVETMIRSTDNIQKMESLYKNVSKELDSLNKEIDNLDMKNLNVTKVHEIILKLRDISGHNSNENLGRGTNEHKARAMAYEAWLYRIMIQAERLNGTEVWIVSPINNSQDFPEREGETTENKGESPTQEISNPPLNNYTVQRGDTFTSIAEDHRMSLRELKDLNPGIKNYSLIYPGQVINVSPEFPEGNLTDFLDRLAEIESGRNPQIINNDGYMGLYQVNSLTLRDVANRNNGDIDLEKINERITSTLFRENPSIFPEALQNKVVLQSLANNKFYLRNKWNSYIGKTISKSHLNGSLCENNEMFKFKNNDSDILITPSGLLAASHAAGAGGINSYLEDYLLGRTNFPEPVDGASVSAMCYLREFANYELNLGTQEIDYTKSVSFGDYETLSEWRISEENLETRKIGFFNREKQVNVWENVEKGGFKWCKFNSFNYTTQIVNIECNGQTEQWKAVVFTPREVSYFEKIP